MKALALALSGLLAAISFGANAAVEAGHIRLEPFNTITSYGAVIDQTPSGDDVTGVFFDYTGSTLEGLTFHLDEGADLFVAPAGLAFTDGAVEAGLLQPVAGRTIGLASASVPLGGDFYLALRTSSGWGADLPNPFSIYGWALLHPSADGLTLVDSAVAFGEKGIVVGAVQAVPEPAVGLLALTGLAVAGLTRRPRDFPQVSAWR